MNISKLTLAWKFLTGGGTGVIDYVLDVANNAVNGLSTASKDKVAEVLATTKKVLETARSLSWLVPSKWANAYALTLTALADVVNVCEDLKLTPEELTQVVTAWQSAYSSWRAE